MSLPSGSAFMSYGSSELSTKEDVDRLLILARELLDRTERAEGRVLFARTLEAGIIALACVAAILVLGLTVLSALYGFAFIVASAVLVLVVIIGIEQAVVRTAQRDIERDRTALFSIIQLLRATADGVSDEWSALERAELKITLARYP